MRTPQGLIFAVPAGQAAQPAPRPFVSAQADKELQARLERLFTEESAAFWVEDWDRACARFQAVLDARPDYPEAAARLQECIHQQKLTSLYTRAMDLQNAALWEQAIPALEELLKESPDYKDAPALLKTARQQKRLADLYAEAHKFFEAGQWLAVVRVFRQISAIEPNYPDADQLLPAAQKEAAALERRATLDGWYRRAVRAMDAGQWQQACDLFYQIRASEPGFLETEKLLARAEGEAARQEELRKREAQVNLLYEQAHGLMRVRQWRNALAKLDEIRKLDDKFEDTDHIAAEAREALERKEDETQRQGELSTMYAAAVQLLKEERFEDALEKWN